MADLENMSDPAWHTLLQNLLVEYVTLLTNPESPAPSAPILTRQEILEHDATRKEASGTSSSSAAAANAGSDCGCGDGGGDGGNGDGGDGDSGDGDGDEADDTSGPAAKAGRGGGGRRGSEPFVGCLFPWRNCNGGAWNKPLLISHTSIRIE